MQTRKNNQPNAQFRIAFVSSAIVGTLVCLAIYSLVYAGPIQIPLLKRFCDGRPTTFASLWLFSFAITALCQKGFAAYQQSDLVSEAAPLLDEMASNCPASHDRSLIEWFDTVWKSQSTKICESWLGLRITTILNRQIDRQHTQQLERDMNDVSACERLAQRNGFSGVRLAVGSIALLGILGTTLSLSSALSQTEIANLAAGVSEPSRSLAKGLSTAFDPLGLSVALCMIIGFAKYFADQREQSVLSRVDEVSNHCLLACLSSTEAERDISRVETALVTITTGVLASVEQVVQKQAELWRDTISGAHDQWTQVTSHVASTVRDTLGEAIDSSLANHREELEMHTEHIARIQAEGALQIDSRLQQWQTTLSEQARVVHRQQQEMTRLAELLQKLIDSSNLIGAMETPIQSTLERLTDVDRFHEAAICLTEAVAVLGTQMERYGYLGRQPVRRRYADNDTKPNRATGADLASPSLSIYDPETPHSDIVGTESVDDSDAGGDQRRVA